MWSGVTPSVTSANVNVYMSHTTSYGVTHVLVGPRTLAQLKGLFFTNTINYKTFSSYDIIKVYPK
jgi:hypothetical protein